MEDFMTEILLKQDFNLKSSPGTGPVWPRGFQKV
jgi:hypothetical protein